MEIEISYEPLPWQEEVHRAQQTNLCLVGGLGSGKTTTAIRELQALALENPGFTYLIARKTMPSLRDTAMKSFFSIMEPGLIAEHNKTHSDVKLINGAEFIFRGLDDLEKFKSLEIAGFFVNEANEIDKEMYNTLKSRVRQKVRGKAPTRYRTIIDLNPTEEDHWIPETFVEEKPKDHKIFFSSSLQNEANLPEGYIEGLVNTYTPDMAKRMIDGQFGKVFRGRPVFPQYARNPSYFKKIIEPIEKNPIFIGIDFGFNRPSWSWLQFINGQARILASKLGHQTKLEDFILECEKYERELWEPWPQYKYYCDPRGDDSSDKGKSSIEILNDHGIFPIFRRTYIEEGIKAMHGLMDTKTQVKDERSGLIIDEPNLIIHPRCTVLNDALKGGYHRLDGEEQPHKDKYYDNVVDSVRYPLIHLTKMFRMSKAQHIINNQRTFVHPVTGRTVQY